MITHLQHVGGKQTDLRKWKLKLEQWSAREVSERLKGYHRKMYIWVFSNLQNTILVLF